MQEDELKALGQMPDVESEHSEEAESRSDSSDEMFGFGMAKPAKKEKKRKATASGDGKKQAKVEKANAGSSQMAKAKEYLELLGQVHPLNIWLGSVKDKDVETKLGKALALTSALSSLEPRDDECVKMATKLEAAADSLAEILALLTTFKKQIAGVGTDGNSDILTFPKETIHDLCRLPSECLSTMITNIGRNLSEAGRGQ